MQDSRPLPILVPPSLRRFVLCFPPTLPELEHASERQGGAEDIQSALAHVRREKQWGVAIEVSTRPTSALAGPCTDRGRGFPLEAHTLWSARASGGSVFLAHLGPHVSPTQYFTVPQSTVQYSTCEASPFSAQLLGPPLSPLSSCCPAGVPQVYEWLLLQGLLRPDVRTYNLVLEAYGRSGQPHKCAALFQAMQEGTAAVQEAVRAWGGQATPVTSQGAPVTSPSAVTSHSTPVAEAGSSHEEDGAEGVGAAEARQGDAQEGGAGAEGGGVRTDGGPTQRPGEASEGAPLAVGGAPPAQERRAEETQTGSEGGAEGGGPRGGVVAEGSCILSEASWNVLIAAYCQAGLPKEADAAFEEMKARGYTPSKSACTCTFICEACLADG